MNYELLKKLLAVFALSLFGIFYYISYAQSKPRVYLETQYKNLAPGSEFVLRVLVESDKAFNAFDLEVVYPKELELISLNNAGSIADIWRGYPGVVSEGLIKLEGGLSNPFQGHSGEIIKLNFRVKTEGDIQLTFNKSLFYLADGLGTPFEFSAGPIALKISGSGSVATVDQRDTIPPKISDLEIVQIPSKEKILVFRAQDFESGLRAVEARERKWFSWSDWHIVSNPMNLQAGIWAAELKVFDNQGNLSKKTIYISQEIIKKILLLITLIGVFTCLIFRRKLNVIIKKWIS
jgi:preprotein translocase subunit YajC